MRDDYQNEYLEFFSFFLIKIAKKKNFSFKEFRYIYN